MAIIRPRNALSAVALLALVGCGSATVGAVGSPASAKWVGPPVTTPDGGQVRTTIYYGPWQCSAAFMSRCETKCAVQGRALMGCIWLADIKGDWQGRFMLLPAEAGGRLAITHCCCDYPTINNVAQQRRVWSRARESFRESWAEEFGAWPQSGGTYWEGHHIFDLWHGGPPSALNNVLPVPGEVHAVINRQYPACYAGGGQWSTPGPNLPYAD
ncbi:hypothetical protein [Corallococcus llansteffanensis]|uniref:HNH endonuclease n=1 Tax=Corallococcus llansteffanensis TaxID=2316731 RepID=A0A3A8PVP9_9BACT|nr:hypothetical protein [Corallococcus llansteffanensis]RKH59100.1 hypothetical protein D7V93_15555 [Corallococcus llansteffanensis]